ncbi:DNA-directed DNA polymerase II small subunit [Methanohalophilus sp.]|uniref:DNA-directed DNA polymerase II small subunit n=1 Tax=Methanohalophilus sp. TaxID=1966352 RepID=UPI0026149C9E|nr:DNA-directed DNA polymerase II small subunit [Methanohalophilus sp.]MDK2892456.1 polymerase small subunit [Methanohalophilus sp.]
MSGESGQQVIFRLMEEGYQVSPEAAEFISSHCQSPKLAEHILSNLEEDVFVIDIQHLDLDSFTGKTSSLAISEIQGEFNNEKTEPLFSDNPVEVLSDITDSSTCVGEYMEFVQYFRNRYSRLSEFIRGRINARPLESLNMGRRSGNGEYEDISIIGMVSDIRSTSNGHRLIQFEDPTGSFPVLFTTSEKDLFEQASHLVLDDVVGVSGKLTNDGRLLIANKLIFPDVPNGVFRSAPSSGKAVFISDVHIGSTTFLDEQWEAFISFLKGESPDENLKKLAQELRYLVVAGDIVDGVGIYPGQENELVISDVYKQYEKAAEYFNQVPEHIRVIICPGNHDAVRQAEPQPALPKDIQEMFDDRIIFVGNPALVNLDGAYVLMYHGRSIDDFVASVPGVSYQEPTKAMVEMIKRRHLSPIYGSRVPIAPEKTDHFVIDRIPDILHCGHVHTVGVEQYRGVLLINSGTWQSQTEFQKRVNVVPTPAQVPVVDMCNFKTMLLQF